MADPEDDTDVPVGDDYLWDRSGTPDPEVARLEALLSPLAHDAPLRLPARADDDVVPIARARARRRWPVVGIAAAVAIAAVIALVVIAPWKRRAGGGGGTQVACSAPGVEGFAFTGNGAVSCAGESTTSGTLAVGSWIETGDTTARVEVATIGDVELQPRSRLALRGTSDTEHRLALEYGSLHAKVLAPPRLFVIETPSATAIDLGCEYDLVVAADGTGSLAVITGQVELAAPTGGLVVVPALMSVTFTSRGVGLPLREGASNSLREAVAAFDPAKPATVEAVLAASMVNDAVTVMNLLALAGPYQRERVFDVLQELSPAPDDVLRDAVIAGDADAIDRWRRSVVDGWMYGTLAPRDQSPSPRDVTPGKKNGWKRPDPPDAAVDDVPPMPPDQAPDPSGWNPQ
jgi:ferric-dicitrate binding protein FerR (iron transport regulator)